MAKRQQTCQAPPRSTDTLVRRLPPGKASARVADLLVEGQAVNALIVRDWSAGVVATVEITDLFMATLERSARVRKGDLGDLEEMLAAQIVSMNAVFGHMLTLAKRAKLVDHFELYIRLGLRFQSQCRATAETLAQMKTPNVFAKTANIVNGPQQINGAPLGPATSRAIETAIAPSKLLEAAHDGNGVDHGAARTATTGDPIVEALAVVDGATHAGRKSPRRAQRLSRRPTAKAPSRRPRAVAIARPATRHAAAHR